MVEHCTVDQYDPRSESGYQRSAVDRRGLKVADYYRSGGLMAGPLLLNIRAEHSGDVRLSVIDGGAGAFEEALV